MLANGKEKEAEVCGISSSSSSSVLKCKNENMREDNDSMAVEEASAVEEERWEGLPKKELVMLLLQTMDGLGYGKAVSALEEEAGIPLEVPAVRHLHNGVIVGMWAEVLKALQQLNLDDVVLHACRFLVLEQKYLELLFKQNLEEALSCLREELSEACFDEDTTNRLHKCCCFLMCQNPEDLQQRAQWKYEGSRKTLWFRIQRLVPPYIIPPAKRLAVLIHQAYKLQELHCMYHNIAIPENNYFSLLQDHECPRQSLPTQCIGSLDVHTDEVWNVAISHKGKYIASSSKDKTIILWDSSPPSFKMLQRWNKHKDAISYVSWSPSDEYLASASNDRTIIIWTPSSEDFVVKIDGHTESVTSVGWLPDSRHLISTGFDKQMILWKLTDNPLNFHQVYKWTFSSRLQDCVVTADGSYCVVVASDKTIRIIDIKSRKEMFSLPETDPVTSITASALYKQVLVNISDQKPVIRLWDLNERRIVQRYCGHKQGRFVVRSAFGGPNESFVLSGSEDSQVYIWHRFYSSLLEVLPGHAGTVNAVVWPVREHCHWMISASDDHTLLIWHTEQIEGRYNSGSASNDCLTDKDDLNDASQNGKDKVTVHDDNAMEICA